MQSFAMTSLWLALCSIGQTTENPKALPRSAPESQGVSSAAILDFVNQADQKIDAMHSLMVLRHGIVVAEGWWAPYAANLHHSLFSVTKSFTSTGVGIAIAEGKLSVDDEVLKFFPEQAPANPSEHLKAMRVKDLLRMATGQQSEASFGLRSDTAEPWTKVFLNHPVPFKPGTHFLYNTPGSFMLSAIVQKATGEPLRDYLQSRLFEPLGIVDPVWDKNPQGITIGGYGLNLHTEDLAKFGQLYLQKGKWNGKQIVPETWVEAATSLQTSNGSNPKSDWDQGYGYQFWRSRNKAYRGDGAFGQYCVVIPELDAVIIITSGVRNMQAVLDLVWDTLYPAFKPGLLTEDLATNQKLKDKLAGLTLPSVPAGKTSGAATRVAGKTYVFPENDRKLESIALESGPGTSTTLVVKSNGSEQKLVCGSGQWQSGRFQVAPMPEATCAASGAWITDETFRAKIYFQETPFSTTYDLTFTEDQVKLNAEAHVGFGPSKPPELIGKSN